MPRLFSRGIDISFICMSKRCTSTATIVEFYRACSPGTPFLLMTDNLRSTLNRYWNWSLDWEDLSKSPVWDNETGFGGSGSGAESVANGRCVLDGPFAGAQAAYYEGNYHPHCLSRGFLADEVIRRVGRLTVQPAILNRVFEEQDYYDFLLKVEQASHLTIPYIVQGDFSKVTAPNGMLSYGSRPHSFPSVIVHTNGHHRPRLLPSSWPG